MSASSVEWMSYTLTDPAYVRDMYEHVPVMVYIGWFDYIKDYPGNKTVFEPNQNLWTTLKTQLNECNTSSVPNIEVAFRDICKDIGKYEKGKMKTPALCVSDHLSVFIVHKRRPKKY